MTTSQWLRSRGGTQRQLPSDAFEVLINAEKLTLARLFNDYYTDSSKKKNVTGKTQFLNVLMFNVGKC